MKSFTSSIGAFPQKREPSENISSSKKNKV